MDTDQATTRLDDPCPMPWQSQAWEQLERLVVSDRLPHGILLEGAPGTGRGLFAEAFARRALCHTPRDGRHCGECKSCLLCASGAHADLLRVAPEETGKAIGIAAVRNAIDFAARTTSIGQRKVMLIAPAESMTTAAFNAFLKCLEEPAADTLILMVFASGYPLPTTIRSRCQRWLLPTPAMQAATQWLENLTSAPDAFTQSDSLSVAEAIAATDGRPLEALSLLESGTDSAVLKLLAVLPRARESGNATLPLLDQLAQALEPDALLEILSKQVRRELRAQSAASLRSGFGLDALQALDTFAELRGACLAGTNPNVDLLRFRALKAFAGLWEN